MPAFTAAALAFSLLGCAPTEPWAPPGPDERRALAARHARPDGEPGFVRVAAGSYVVRTDLGPEFAIDAACFLERFRSQFDHIFRDVPPPARYPPLVVVFREEARYRRKMGGSGARGMFVATDRAIYTYLDAAAGERDFATFYKKILLHEGAHEMLFARCGSLPVWFDEGVACYFQEWDVRLPVAENLERLRTTHFRFADVRDAFGTERWVPLARLLSLDRATWAPDDYGPRTTLHYAEAASFVSFLLATAEGRSTFARLYRSLKQGDSVETALGRAEIQRLDRAWRAEIERQINQTTPKNPLPPPAQNNHQEFSPDNPAASPSKMWAKRRP